MKKLLLHICCAPCCSVPIKRLKDHGFDVSCFFYNPNIYPASEELKRRDEVMNFLEKERIPYLAEDGDHDEWLSAIKGLELEPEGGSRCLKCYEMRIRRTAEIAKEQRFDAISVTLTLSPHKNAEKINEIGREVVREFGLEFIEEDFKKQDGFKESIEISCEEGFYRQNYCGCEFSRR